MGKRKNLLNIISYGVKIGTFVNKDTKSNETINQMLDDEETYKPAQPHLQLKKSINS